MSYIYFLLLFFPFATDAGYVVQEHGLYELEDGRVALKCDKKREAEGFPDVDPHFEGILRLSELCHTLPVHAIWGTRNDFVYVIALAADNTKYLISLCHRPEFIQESLGDAADGRPMTSVTKVKGCGHMVYPLLISDPEKTDGCKDCTRTTNMSCTSYI